jgi:hypothetical protein
MTMGDELYQPRDERMRDAAVRVALIERSILMLLFVGLLIGVLAVVIHDGNSVRCGAGNCDLAGTRQ